MMKWENNVRKVVPYVPGAQPNKEKMIKLNTNECPYPPAPGVEKALQEMNISDFRLYPDPNITGLTQGLADCYGLKKEQVFVGVGSDDVIAMAFLTFFNSDKPILFPDITYSFYDVWADLYGIPYKTCKLQEDWHINPADYMQENGGIVIANPNAPTGLMESLDTLEEIIKANPDVIVIVDEAYVDFGGVSALPLLEKYENLLVVQTFSKSRAMAGMRIGYAMGGEKLIGYLNDVKFAYNSYTMNKPSQVLGLEMLKDKAYFEEIVGKIVKTREWTKKELTALGFTFPDSKTNFIFATHDFIPARDIFEALEKENIFVRYWNKERISNCLRISVGTDEEMEILVDFLKDYVKTWRQ